MTLAVVFSRTSEDVANTLGGVVSGCVLMLLVFEIVRAVRQGRQAAARRLVSAGASGELAPAAIMDAAALPSQFEEGSPVRVVVWAQRWWLVLLVVLGCWGAVSGYGTPIAVVMRLPDPAVGVYFAVVGLVSIWLLYRACRLEARFDDKGVTLRNFFRTRRFGWSEVSHFADGWTEIWTGEDAGTYWAAAIVLRDGRHIVVKLTMGGKSVANPETLETIRQIAARYGIPGQLTGKLLCSDR